MKIRKCSKGFPCGKTCISKTRKCWANLSDENNKIAETFSQYVDRISSKKTKFLNETIAKSIENVSNEEVSNREKQSLEELGGVVSIDIPGMTDGEKAVAIGYTQEDYEGINNYLRGVDTDSTYNAPLTKAFIKSFDKLPSANNSETKSVYRGLTVVANSDKEREFAEYLDSLEVGSSYQDFGFSSTSKSKGIATEFLYLNPNESFKDYLFVYTDIDDDFKDLEPLNDYGEKELLIRNGKEFKVKDIKEELINDKKVKVIYL